MRCEEARVREVGGEGCAEEDDDDVDGGRGEGEGEGDGEEGGLGDSQSKRSAS